MRRRGKSQKACARIGHSIFEVLVTVTVVGILATITAVDLGNLKQGADRVKLDSDLQTMNRAVASFIGANGNPSDCRDAEEVLARLKTAANSASSKRLLGFTGSATNPRPRPPRRTSGEK